MTTEEENCKRCILGSDIPEIVFNDEGICNYCEEFDELTQHSPLGKTGSDIVQSKVDEMKKAGRNNAYDCIVGVSGGVDSTYVLYKVVELGLRPLAVLFDNGWNSEIAVSNIKNVTSKLNVDLETFVVDWEEFKSILISFLKASVPHADIPTDIGIKSTLYKTAVQNKIKYIITGGNFRTEGKIPREWSYMDGRYIKSVHKIFSSKRLKSFPNLTLFDYFKYMFFHKIEVFRILNYVEYQKPLVKDFLQKELGWRDYGGKHYESIFTRFNQTAMRYQKFGIDMRKIEYAALVRSGQISRNKALDELAKEPFTIESLQNDVDYVIKKLGLTKDEYNEIVNLPIKKFTDYPTYFNFINATRPIINFLQKFRPRM
jgi:N-acetyl sugar amidotransferase